MGVPVPNWGLLSLQVINCCWLYQPSSGAVVVSSSRCTFTGFTSSRCLPCCCIRNCSADVSSVTSVESCRTATLVGFCSPVAFLFLRLLFLFLLQPQLPPWVPQHVLHASALVVLVLRLPHHQATMGGHIQHRVAKQLVPSPG